MMAFILVLVVSLVPLALVTAQSALIWKKQQSALEAAALAGAKDLEKIIVNDPHFGYIALSDYPPCGKATIAADGEPLPVLGINTVIGTARLETIIANDLGNPDLTTLAQADAAAARSAAKLLQDKLISAIQPNNRYPATDLDGNVVTPYEHARQTYLANCPASVNLVAPRSQDFHLSLGWLNGGSSTITPIPQPLDSAEVPDKARVKDHYKAFIDIPASGESFYFAGLAQQPALVQSNEFREPDGKQICSVLKAESSFTVTDNGMFSSGSRIINLQACAIPSSLADSSTPGAMILSFPDGPPSGIKSISDIFGNPQLNSNTVPMHSARGGDFPDDPRAHLVPSQDSYSIASIFSRGFYDWLRTAHCRPRIDSVLQVVNSNLADYARSGSGSQVYPLFVYEFDRSGNVTIVNHLELPFLAQTIYENQVSAISFQAMNTGSLTWTMSYRDQVSTLGTQHGGQHAGQSMPGDPINWCDLARYDGSPEWAAMQRKGTALGVMVLGDQAPDSGIPLSTAYFSKLDGKDLSSQPRKNYYSGGLAVEFKLVSAQNNTE